MFGIYLREVFASIRARGYIATLKVLIAIFHGYLKDWLSNIDTMPWVMSEHLKVPADRYDGTRFYAPTPALSFTKLIESLRGNVTSGAFLDVGSGKGGVLLVASSLGLFDVVRGIEFSPLLVTKARLNISGNKGTPIELIEADLRDYELNDDESFIYLYDPFDEELIKKLVVKIKASLDRKRRSLLIAYCNPIHGSIFQKDPAFKLFSEYHEWGYKFLIFSTNAH